jgi:hypothetical protein
MPQFGELFCRPAGGLMSAPHSVRCNSGITQGASMKRTILAAFFGLAIAFTGAKAAHAQVGSSFIDGCPGDITRTAVSIGQTVTFGPANVHLNRPGCPWFIVDITQATGHKLATASEWSFGTPGSPALCNGARMSYVMAKKVNANTYTIVGSGTVTGQWVNWFGSQFCATNVNAGTFSTTINNSPDANYRFLFRNWASNGAETWASGRAWLDGTVPR